MDLVRARDLKKSDYNIVEIDQNTEKRPGDQSGLAVTQTQIKFHQRTLMGKIHMKCNNNIHKLSGILYIYLFILIPDIGLAVRVFANGPGDLGSIPGRVIPKTQKMQLDASLLNTQHYKVRIKGKVEKSRERSSALSYI